MKGWVKIDRQILDFYLWNQKPFDKAHAWVDLILMANHKDNKLMIDGSIVVVERGELVTSILKLSNRWGWNRRTTANFLDVLESDKMITQKRTTRCTTIKLVNYGVYQGFSDENAQPSAQLNAQLMHNRVHTNKNIKNVKNERSSTHARGNFSTFAQNDYDFDDIEKKLLSN